MTPAQLAALKAAILANATWLALARQGKTQDVAAAMSVGRKKLETSGRFTSIDIADQFAPAGGLSGPVAAEALIQKLEAYATQAKLSGILSIKLLGGMLQRQMASLTSGGMPLASPAFGSLLAAIVAATGITQAEADALQNTALIDDPVTHTQVGEAIAGGI